MAFMSFKRLVDADRAKIGDRDDEYGDDLVEELPLYDKVVLAVSGFFTRKPDNLPKDYWFNSDHHPNLIWPIRKYMDLSWTCQRIVNKSETFNLFITGTICVAGVMVGVQTYPSMAVNSDIDLMDFAILGIFTMECMIKIVMEGLKPYYYFIGPEWRWNDFDFTIVLLSFPFWGGLFGGSSIALLRLVRLARLGKLIRKIPPLQVIVKGLAGGLSSISYIMILMFLIYYLFAVMGFFLFATNDPFHFGNVPMALHTLFRISTLDNWGDVMFVNLFGCDYYADIYQSPEDWTVELHSLRCANPGGNLMLGIVFFISFVVISAMVMLSLFIGAVTLSMNESMEELKKSMEEKKAKEAFAKNKARIVAMKKAKAQELESSMIAKGQVRQSPQPSLASLDGSDDDGGGGGDDGSSTASPMNKDDNGSFSTKKKEGNEGEDDEDDEDEEEEIDDEEKLVVVKEMAARNPIYWLQVYMINRRMTNIQAASIEQKEKLAVNLKIALGSEGADAANAEKEKGMSAKEKEMANKKKQAEQRGCVGRMYSSLADSCMAFSKNPNFNQFMTGIILIASLNVGVQTDNRVMSIPLAALILNVYLDQIILGLFTFEVILKIIGEGFTPLNYFNDSWNKFDFMIVAGSFVPGAGSTVVILRLLRLLRVLKLLKRFPQLAVIVNALLNSASSIGYVGLVLFLFLYLFAIVGMMFFQQNDPWHFGNLHLSLITLFRYITLDSAADVAYVNMFGCDQYGGIYLNYPEQCTSPQATGLIAALYFMIFTIIGAQTLLSLFIGVIATSMDEAKERQKVEQKLDLKLAKTSEKLLLSEERIQAFRDVFGLLDLDGGGTIDEEELKIGLEAIDAHVSNERIVEILSKVDPEGEGVDVDGFIYFMAETPYFSSADKAMAQINRLLKKSNKAKKAKAKEPFYQILIDVFVHGGKANRIKMQEEESAMIIQDEWAKYLAKVEAKRIFLEKKALKDKQLLIDVGGGGGELPPPSSDNQDTDDKKMGNSDKKSS